MFIHEMPIDDTCDRPVLKKFSIYAMTAPDDIHRAVSEYYSESIHQTSDLKYQACICTVPRHPRHSEILAQFSPDVLSKYYGCGSPIPDCLSGQTILDLGCGTGRDVFLCSVLAGSSGRAIGVDMTDDQLSIGTAAIGHHRKTFPDSAPVEFHRGLIEDLKSAGIEDGSVDVVISNCVVNLVPDKQAVFSEVFRVLRENGEMCISDIFTDRPLPQAAREDKTLVGECIGNAITVREFVEMMRKAGFDEIWPVSVSHFKADGIGAGVIDPATIFFKITCSAFKFAERECKWRGDVATYNGGIPDCEEAFDFDLNHRFPKGVGVPVCSKLASVLGGRYQQFFEIRTVEPVPEKQASPTFLETVFAECQTGTTTSTAPCCCCGCEGGC
jgi:ubiquinone/menaquinone biosynthesis C-methylase UbiE